MTRTWDGKIDQRTNIWMRLNSVLSFAMFSKIQKNKKKLG